MSNIRRTKITDIAAHLGISITTVSFILNDKGKENGLSDKLIKKVLQYAEKVNYKPNSLAKSLRTGKTNIIGLLVEDISNPFFANIARLIEERAYDKGYRIVYCSTMNDTQKTIELIQMFRDQHVDGYIIAPPEGIEKSIKQLSSDGKPVVIFDRYNSSFNTDQVVINNYESVKEAIQHLIDNGYRNIGFATIVSGQSQMQDRYQAYADVLATNKLVEHVLRVPLTASDHSSIITAVRNFYLSNDNMDALFFANNYLGVYGLEAINSLGAKLVKKMGLISFDDRDLFRLYSPTITAIDQPFELMADKIITLLFDRINGNKVKKPTIEMLNATLVVRQSSKKRN